MISNSVILRQRSSTLTGLIKRSFAAEGKGKFYGSSDSLLPTYLPKPGSGNLKKISVLPGSKIGPMLVDSVEKCIKHCDINLNLEKFGDVNDYDEDILEKLSNSDAILRGPFYEGKDSKGDIFLPKQLDLYAYVVHAFSIPGITSRHDNIDIVVIRENSEGEYSTIEHEVLPGIVESIKVTTKEKSIRIAEYAFEYAMLSNRAKVTCVHKANIIKKGDGEFLDAAREVSDRYPRIKLEEMIIDATCMNLIQHPDSFDVILVPNLYGAIIGNVVAGLVGGAGIAPGASIGKTVGMFEQGARCAGTDLIKTQNANPTAFILSACMMLRYLNLPYYADSIQEGVFRTIRSGKNLTPDLGGTANTEEFTKEVIRNIY